MTEVRGEARLDALAGDAPFVSVLVPVRNEAGFIGRCLTALARQDYRRDRFEVILLDGESTDATVDEAQAAAEAGLPLNIVTNPKRRTAAGLNLGRAIARGEVIVRVDGHAEVAPDYLSACVRALRETGADAVGGPIETRGEGVVGRAIALAVSSPFGVGDAAFRLEGGPARWTDSVPFAAYRRSVFERIGGFTESIDRGEDDEFNYRLRDAGRRVLLTPTLRSVYYSRASLAGLARQYWGYGLAKAAVLGRHPRRLRPRHLVPSALVLAVAGGALLGPFDRRFRRLGGLAGGAYLLATALATLQIARRGHRREAPYLPACFAAIHLSAGAGMVAGCLRLLLRRHDD